MIRCLRSAIVAAALLIGMTSAAFAQVPDISLLNTKAPEHFRAEFKTTKGNFTIEATRNWSPHGVDRLYQLIRSGYFTNNLVFRMEPGFVVQFGISPDKAINKFWDPKKIPDEPLRQRNTKGMIGYARDFKDTRCAQLFIDLADNPKLDTTTRNGVLGFPPIARVIKGMNVVAAFNARHKKKPAVIQDSLYKYGNTYFEKKFPGLDKILSAHILP